jgi:O-methyltransferase
VIDNLINNNRLISDQIDQKELKVILRELKNILERGVPGEAVEMGCYVGTTSLFIRRLINHLDSGVEFHVYDSFEGLPSKTDQDSSPAGTQFKEGELTANKKQLLQNFKKAGLRPPVIHKGFFEDLTVDDMPTKISFAFLDGDFYSSIQQSINLVWPRLSPRGVIVVDDYQSEALPGVKRAVEEFAQHALEVKTEQSLAIIRK